MARQRPLSRAPITEALFDFRVVLPSDFNPEILSGLRDSLRDKYPIVEEMRRFTTMIELRAGKSSSTPTTESLGLQGYLFKSDDGLDVVQFRRDGFTFNRLSKYTSWNVLCPEALRLWKIFVAEARPSSVSRLALRYINRIRLPSHGTLEDYVAVGPPELPGGPELVTSFVVKQSRHDPETGDMVNFVQALDPNFQADATTLILDIDVYRSGDLGLNEEELLPILNALRRIKNDIFFGSITERTAAQYE